MAQNDKNRKKMHFILSIRVRDSDPLGTRPAQRGLVLGGWRQAKRRWRPLKYSPTAHICAEMPLSARCTNE